MIPISKSDSTPLSRQIYTGLRTAILNGVYRAGERLPSTRTLADQLSVSRTIVVIAFEQLLAEGFVKGQGGSGTFVSEHLGEVRTMHKRKPARLRLSRFGQSAMEVSDNVHYPPLPQQRLRYDFAYSRSNTDAFPFETWRRILIRKLREAPVRELDYGASAGSSSLRVAIVDHLRRSRGVACDASQVIIVNGSQQALDLTTRVLLNPGDRVVIENPHYQGTREIFAVAGATIYPVGVDSDGLMTSALPKRARLAVVTPSHQFPTGAILPLSRRLALLDWAKRADAVIVEDDYDGEFRYEGQPVEPLQSLDTEERVVYVGTFSRTVFPSLRLGYLIAPKSLVSAFVAAKWLCDRHSATLEQETLAEFIRSGAYERHLRRARRMLAERRAELLSCLKENLGNTMEISGENAGLHLVIWPKARVSEKGVITKAAAHDVRIYGVSQYFKGKALRPGFLLGYARLTRREIREGIKRLGEIECFKDTRQ
ncbi:MAG: transcriptional regulator, GntR family [Acidobacteriales bacterium]|nr:transcriptional regulator, GntR family [Terriglobales bacterium]